MVEIDEFAVFSLLYLCKFQKYLRLTLFIVHCGNWISVLAPISMTLNDSECPIQLFSTRRQARPPRRIPVRISCGFRSRQYAWVKHWS